jgi:putative ATPase
VLTGIKEIKEVMADAERKARSGARTIVFVDEVHRFNKAQQDAFLPHVEAGHITFIGATTENPSFEVISPLLSRTKVYILDPLTTPQIVELLRRALADKERGLGNENIEVSDEILFRIASYANGDARAAYNTLELAARSAIRQPAGALLISPELLQDVLQRKLLRYDKAGEEHYNLISALHKSVRNSDPDAALYWLARMLESGEDALYLARRLVRMASEDIGLAEPGALAVTLAAKDAFRRVSFSRAKIQRALHWLRRSPRRRAQNRSRSRPAAPAQRPHRPDEKRRLRQRLPIRPQLRRQSHGHAVSPRQSRRSHLLSTDRPRFRATPTPAPRRNPQDQVAYKSVR